MGLFNTFNTGDLVRTSGVYAALHSTPHALIERAIYVEGSRFRRCRLCPLGVLYRLEEPGAMSSSTHLAKEESVLGCT
jgi:hypothetical protein